jgi:hypothetical protein
MCQKFPKIYCLQVRDQAAQSISEELNLHGRSCEKLERHKSNQSDLSVLFFWWRGGGIITSFVIFKITKDGSVQDGEDLRQISQ